MGLRVELFADIRRDARVEGLSIRELARRHQVGRDTVRQALANPLPPSRKTPVRKSRRLDRFKPAIDVMLQADITAPRKQRHTARRILVRLVEEHCAEGLSYSRSVTTCGSDGHRSMLRRGGGWRCSFLRSTRRGVWLCQLNLAPV